MGGVKILNIVALFMQFFAFFFAAPEILGEQKTFLL